VIASVRGTVLELRAQSVVVQAGPFGVELLAPAATLARCSVGAEVVLHAQLVVREDSLTLYGFLDADSLVVFRHLLGVAGVGPKLALAILSTLRPALIADAVAREDAGLLASAPGVGKRTAERMVLELKSKLPPELAAGAPGRARGKPPPAAEDAIAALLALGYREAQVRAQVQALLTDEPDASAEAIIRSALARLR
jgi:holliday junction DNA helicase RuvA